MADTGEGQIVEDKRGQQHVEFPSGEKFDSQGYVGETRVGWMCFVDFCVELGEHICSKDGTPEGIPVYASLEELREARKCTSGCGYTKVILIALEVGKGTL